MPVIHPFPRIAERLRVALPVMLVFTAACETVPEVVPVDDPEGAWAARQVLLAGVEAWTAVGKLGIQSDADSWSAGFTWRQRRDTFGIRLSGPLGQGLMELSGSEGMVELRTADGAFRAPSAEELMQSHAGWQVPLAGLRYWILGRPDPEAPLGGFELDAAGRLASLRQLGWHIRYERYGEFDGMALPTRLSLENSRLRAKIAVRTWHPEPAST